MGKQHGEVDDEEMMGDPEGLEIRTPKMRSKIIIYVNIRDYKIYKT